MEMFPSACFYLLLNRLVDRQHIPFYSATLRRNHWEEQRRSNEPRGVGFNVKHHYYMITFTSNEHSFIQAGFSVAGGFIMLIMCRKQSAVGYVAEVD